MPGTQPLDYVAAVPPRTELRPLTLAGFWWRDARLALLLLVCVTLVVSYSSLDTAIAHRWFYSVLDHAWIGAGNWWVNAVLHEGGRWLVRGIVASSLLLYLATFVRPQWRELRRPSLFFTAAMVLALGVVGLLKIWTNVDCPWDLQEFGGSFPYIELFAHRPTALRHAQCFPAAHASSGYGLMAVYFVFRERRSEWARVGLIAGMFAGLLFGIAQQSRGAHFLSHDVWSACITWLVSLSVYTFMFRRRVWGVSTH